MKKTIFETKFGNSEQKLVEELKDMKKSDITASTADLRILSYDGDDASGMRFLVFSGDTDSINIVNGAYRTDPSRCASLHNRVINSRYTQRAGENGIWFAYTAGKHSVLFGPRDSRGNIEKGRIPSRFVEDICRYLKIGDVACDFCSPARDVYLATAINEFCSSDRLFVFWLREEETGNVIRPICAFRSCVHPNDISMRNPSDETIKIKNERFRRMFEEAVDGAARIIKKDVGKAYAEDLIKHKEAMFDSFEYGDSCCEKQAGYIRAMLIDPSQLLVVSYLTYNGDNTHSFVILDPWDIEANSFGDIRKRGKNRIVHIQRDRISQDLREEITKAGFLIAFTKRDKRHLLIPGAGFINDFCHRLGVGKISDRRSHAKLAYLASLFAYNDQDICFSTILRADTKTFSVYYAAKTASKANRNRIGMLEAYRKIKERLDAEGFSFESWRIDNSTDVTVNFILCDDHDIPLRLMREKELYAGVELQMSEGLSCAYRLCGVFYYGKSVFYCGNASGSLADSPYGYLAVYGKRKTGSRNLIDNLLDGFFTGVEKNDDGKDIEKGTPVYRYLREQAGILNGGERSPYIGERQRDMFTGSVFEALNDVRVGDIGSMLAVFADNICDEECQIGKKIGKKRILKEAEKYDGQSGTMLDVLLALSSVVTKDAPVNLRHGAMDAIGTYLAKYGYRREMIGHIQ